MNNQIIVVEGIHDMMRIKSVFKDANVITTNGSEISIDTLKMIESLGKDNEIIIFTDPDYPGDRIRKRITDIVPNAVHAFIKKDKCISKNKRKVGVEHATDNDIKEALVNIYRISKVDSDISMADIFKLNLIGNDSSSILREKVSAELNIGTPNAKTFLNRLKMFGIKYEDLKKVVKKFDR